MYRSPLYTAMMTETGGSEAPDSAVCTESIGLCADGCWVLSGDLSLLPRVSPVWYVELQTIFTPHPSSQNKYYTRLSFLSRAPKKAPIRIYEGIPQVDCFLALS